MSRLFCCDGETSLPRVPIGANEANNLQLRLRRLESLDHQVTHIARSLLEIEAHPLRTQPLANNIKLNAILINHVRKTPALINNLTPSIAIEVLAAQLAGADEPRARIPECWVTEDTRCRLAWLEAHLETEKMAIYAAAIAGIVDVLYVRVDCSAEQVDAVFLGHGGVGHGVAESDTLVTDCACGLSAALLEATSGG